MSYDEHLISQAGGDGDDALRDNLLAEVTARNERLLAVVQEQSARLDMLTMACEEAEECGRDWISVKGIRAALESKP